MAEQLNPLTGNRQASESDKAVQACNDWLRLGPGRSLPELLVKYRKIPQNTAPTNSKETLESWSKRFAWSERAAMFDGDLEGKKNDRREEVMQEGLALDYERVAKLKRLAEFLEAQIYEVDDEGKHIRLWVRDVKMIGSGPMATEVELERFNGALLSEYRGTLDDLAKEAGGRKVKTEHSGSVKFEVKAADLTDDELASYL